MPFSSHLTSGTYCQPDRKAVVCRAQLTEVEVTRFLHGASLILALHTVLFGRKSRAQSTSKDWGFCSPP